MAESGTVKWFCNYRGFGFIEPDRGGKELFAHHKNIVMDGYKTLKIFQRVTFDVEHGKNGRHAINIVPGKIPKPPPKTPQQQEPQTSQQTAHQNDCHKARQRNRHKEQSKKAVQTSTE